MQLQIRVLSPGKGIFERQKKKKLPLRRTDNQPQYAGAATGKAALWAGLCQEAEQDTRGDGTADDTRHVGCHGMHQQVVALVIFKADML